MPMEPKARAVTLEQLESLIDEVLGLLKRISHNGATVIALQGDLGAGKTTFVQALGRRLGVNEPITSPTFTILKSYETTDPDFQTLLHMDAYRIDDELELGPLRFAELMATQKALFCIEWPEKITGALTAPHLTLQLTVIDENTRSAHITQTPVNGAAL